MILIDSKASYVRVDVWQTEWAAIDVFGELKRDFFSLFFAQNLQVRFNERCAVSFATNGRCIMYDFR